MGREQLPAAIGPNGRAENVLLHISLSLVAIRNASLARKIPIMTTVRAAQASANGIRSLQKNKLRVRSLQEYQAEMAQAT